MRKERPSANSVPIYSSKSMFVACVACVVFGTLVGVALMLTGWRHLKRTSNPLSFGWEIIKQDPSYDSCGGDVPAKLSLMDEVVEVTTISGTKFKSKYDLISSDDGLDKSIIIHDYLGKEGCDIEIRWSMQPLAHISYRVINGNYQLDMIDGGDVGRASVGYLSCG